MHYLFIQHNIDFEMLREQLRSRLTVAILNDVAEGQQTRTVLDVTNVQYLSKVRVMTTLLNDIGELRPRALILEDEGDPTSNALKHTGDASDVYKLVLPMEPEVGRLLFAALSIDPTLPKPRRGRHAQHDEENEADNDVIDAHAQDRRNPAKNILTVSAQTYQNYKSALKWWHRYSDPLMDKVGHMWSAELDDKITQQIASYKKDVGIKKRKGVMRQKEGKSPYNLTGYIAICSYFNGCKPKGSQSWMEGIFAQLFTKLSVNTIGRSDNIDDMLLANIDWENDALTINFGNTKPDQEGTRTSEKKRIYANPFMPEICPILGLAIYFFCKYRAPGAIHLFDGADQNKRYYKHLVNAVQEIPETVDFGCSRDDVGTHSGRKFAESTATSKVDGPSRTQVCLRAGQSVGRTQDCYVFAEEDGDSLVGRTVTQLKFNCDEFDVLPPHFDTQTRAELAAEGWDTYLEWYNNFPPSAQRVVPYLLANIAYHHHKGTLSRACPHRDHPLYQQTIFKNPAVMQRLKDKVILCHGHCPDTHMSAQGVPGIIIVSREVRRLGEELKATHTRYDEKFATLSRELQSVNESLPERVVTLLTLRARANRRCSASDIGKHPHVSFAAPKF